MSTRLLACAAVGLLVLNGCKDREIVAYRAPKDPAPAAMPAASSAPAEGLPKDHPPIAGGAPAAAGPSDTSMANTAVPTGSDRLTWTAPASWTAGAPRPMRKATYVLKGPDGAEADLSITSFPGDTGGLLANVNRWRGQIALPPLPSAQLDANLQHVDAGSLHIDVVDFTGTANGAPTRILGAIVPFAGETWFFKITGPDAVISAEKPAFLAFLQTIQPR